MSINKKRTTSRKVEKMHEEAHVNFMGAPSYDIKNPLLRLQCVAASCFFGEPSYYKEAGTRGTKASRTNLRTRRASLSEAQTKHLRDILNAVDDYEWRNLSTKQTMERCIDEALAHDPEATLRLAVELRKVDLIRTTPQVIMVRAANHKVLKGSGLIRQYNANVMLRADEPAVQMAYQISEFGKPVPNSLKRSWADFMKKADDYQLAKYRMENRMVKTVDVGNMAFGKGFYGYEGAIGKLMRGELKLGDEIKTWESVVSGGGSWEDALEVMGHMALLRNLRNLINNGVKPDAFIGKLVKTAKHGKQLPFRYWTAHRELHGAPGPVLDAIEECLEISIENVPLIGGRNLVLVDNSGSAHGTPISSMSSTHIFEIGNLMGVLTGLRSDEGTIGVFGDRLAEYSVRKKASIFDQVSKVNKLGQTVGGGTENGIWIALDKAIRGKEHWDNIFVYSDMQAGHGGLYGRGKIPSEYLWSTGKYNNTYIDVSGMVAKYRREVNPNVFVYLVQIAGYEDTLLPEYYDKTYILGGWSSRVLDFAAKMRQIFQ